MKWIYRTYYNYHLLKKKIKIKHNGIFEAHITIFIFKLWRWNKTIVVDFPNQA